MNRSAKWLIGALTVITAVSVLAVMFMATGRPDADKDEQEAVKTPSRVSLQNGRPVISLDSETQAREAIKVAPVTETSMRAELRGTAVLLPVTDLATLRNSHVAARTKLERDQVDLNVARLQYERIKTLYNQNQNMSLKALQDADATYRNTQAQVNADTADAKLQLDTVGQRWGTVMKDWVAGSRSTVEEVLEQREFLAQVVFPPGEVAKPPAMLSLMSPGSQLTRARLVSSLPQVNPQIQGVSFLYVVPARPGMAVGMNLAVLVPVGQLLRGTVVPESAVVWWQGKAWAYEATSPNTFSRREVPTGNPVAGGYFVPGTTFAPGTKLVIAGAQLLLSEEFRSQIQQED